VPILFVLLTDNQGPDSLFFCKSNASSTQAINCGSLVLSHPCKDPLAVRVTLCGVGAFKLITTESIAPGIIYSTCLAAGSCSSTVKSTLPAPFGLHALIGPY